MSNESSDEASKLSNQQKLLRDSFIVDHTPADVRQLSLVDQAAAVMRIRLREGFGLKLTGEKECYDVMVGVAIATIAIQEIIERGVPAEAAAHVTLMTFAALMPRA